MDDGLELPLWPSPRPIDTAVAALPAHPRFPLAVRAFAADMQALAAGDGALDCVLKDVGRYLAAMLSLYLHVTGGLTLPRLKATGTATAYFSPGRARALLLLLCHLGYLAEEPPVSRGVPVRYVPTSRLIAAWKSHLRVVLEAARLIDPSVGGVLSRFHEPEVFNAFCRHHTETGLRNAFEVDQDLAFVRVFLHRYAGSQMLWELLLTANADEFPPTGPIPVSVAATARRLGVSRIHIRRLLDSGVRDGLLRDAGNGTIVLQAPARAAIRFLYAEQFAVFIAAAARTLAEVESPAGRDQKCTVPPLQVVT